MNIQILRYLFKYAHLCEQQDFFIVEMLIRICGQYFFDFISMLPQTSYLKIAS